jgi:hypothetical protein
MRHRETPIKERSRKEKRESMLLDIYISASRLTPEECGGHIDILYDCKVLYCNGE